MKKLIALIALAGAAIGGVSYLARRRGQDIGELAADWSDTVKTKVDEVREQSPLG